MTPILVALGGVAFMAVVIVAFFSWLLRRDALHHFVSDHEFVPWVDIFGLQGRTFGSHAVGVVQRCYRGMPRGLRTELVVESPLLGHGRPHRTRWLLATKVPRGTAFTLDSHGAEGTLPDTLAPLLDVARPNPSVDAVLCGDGLLVVRVVRPRGLEAGLDALEFIVRVLRTTGG
ncbi:hypothetical protein ACTQ49_01270 [Luteococcus sp. Sow4_B9]|uniref:hypothetical protein n=1 Tax=Luteococcus sp. Sow4_B9 TaxID=3438792 RepID=UPI003F994CA0